MKYIFIPVIVLFLSCDAKKEPSKINPEQLRCEYLTNPSVVDVAEPRLDWVNIQIPGNRGQIQTAYEIAVASSPELLNNPDLWKSGKIKSDQSFRVKYGGTPLQSRQECWWQVRVWDKDDKVSDWSETGSWRMGILDEDEWNAEWIGAPWQGEEPLPKPDGGPNGKPKEYGPPAPLLRKTFNIDKKVEKAAAFVTGLGYFELYVNGQKVGDDVLVPNQTNYGKRPNLQNALINVPDHFSRYKVMYLAYDIKSLLVQGKNTIGSILGNGFYNPAKFWAEGYGTPRFFGQIYITYEDGTEEIISTDETWKIAKSPILRNMVYYGEIYDARLEKENWSSPDFDDSQWENVVIKKAPEGELVAHTAHSDRVTEVIPPVSIKKLANGDYQVGFGVEISGWVKFKNIEGPAGHQTEISFNSNQYSGDNTYIFKGNGPENYAPRFNWFVFSGVEIKNFPGELKPENIIAEAVNTYIEPAATFESSNTLFNKINQIWRRSQTDNMHGGIASDCPHRERSAYTGDGQVACAAVTENFDARNFYYKWIADMRDAQNPETGYVPNGAPWQPGCGGGVAWGAAICIMPWEFYEHYGAIDMLEDNYDAMKGYIRYMLTWTDEEGIMYSQRKGANGEILKWFNLGEWVAPGDLPPDNLVHTFYLWMCADITAKTAKKLNNQKEAEVYALLAKQTKTAFHGRFYDPEKGSYGNAGANIFALKMGVPDDQYLSVVTALQNNIKSNNGHFDTGIFGTRYFFEVLADNGMNELAYEALNKTEEPSFGHWIELGSTTTREQWSESGSHNHPMFGGGLVWLYRNFAGLKTDPEHPGYKHIIFKPQPATRDGFASYDINTPYGKAGINWLKENNTFTMDLSVPVGSTATAYIPAESLNKITEGGQKISKGNGVTFKGTEEIYILVELESGEYSFVVKS